VAGRGQGEAEDLEVRFMLLWIGFNAAYARDIEASAVSPAPDGRASAVQAKQARAGAEEAKEHADNEIDQLLIGLNRPRERMSKPPDVQQAGQPLSQAEQQMLAASARETAGLLAQVTNARQNWKTSVLSRNDALTAYYTNYYQLQRSLGTEMIQ
jgi:hypothetical protein